MALAALRNARLLFDDAEQLHGLGRIATSYLLAGLAADELGKHVLVSSFFAREGSEAEWANFWRRFRSHPEKLGNVLFGAWSADLLSTEAMPDAQEFHKRRLAATYVDLGPNGETVAPITSISNDELDDLLSRVRGELIYCEDQMDGVSPARLASVLAKMRDSATTQKLQEIMQGLDPTGMGASRLLGGPGCRTTMRSAWLSYPPSSLVPIHNDG